MSKVDSSILEMKLLNSDITTDGIYDELTQIAKDSIRLYASVAFLTTSGPDPQIINVLKEGYICTDICWPTNLSYLQVLHDSDVDVHLHLQQIKGPKSKQVDGYTHLMHSKLLLFESDKYATIIVGSHNWTDKALGGVNTEDSILIKVDYGAPLHIKTKKRLDWIKSTCLDYNPSDFLLYKSIQESKKLNFNNKKKLTFALLHDSISLSAPMELLMFGDDLSEHAKIPTRKEQCLISIHESSNLNNYQLYDGIIVRETLLPKADSELTAETFPERFHFIRKSGEKKHPLVNIGPIDSSYNNEYKYMVWIRLERRKDTHAKIVEKVSTPQMWIDDAEYNKSNSPLFKNLQNSKVIIEKANPLFVQELGQANEKAMEKENYDVEKIETMKKYFSTD
jgi:HKD family nuclease